MTEIKPRHPLPTLVRRVLHKVLPDRLDRRYVGRHEDASLKLWRQFTSHLRPGAAILDIGAFHGEYSLAAKEVDPNAKVFAFEPNVTNFQILCQSCGNNGVVLVQAAVAEANGAVRFLCEAAQSRIARETDAGAREESYSVRAVSLDSWCSEHAVVPSLIKIDVEGSEAAILRGARGILAEYRPIVLCEVLDNFAGAEVMAALPSFYTYWDIDENHGVAKRKPRIERLRWRDKNWLLQPGTL